MSDPREPEWKPGQPPPWEQPGYGQQPQPGYGQPAQDPWSSGNQPPQDQWAPGDQPAQDQWGRDVQPTNVPYTPMPQQEPPAKKGFLARFGGIIALVVVVGVIAGGFFLFRDRLGGNVSELRVGDCFDLPTADVDITDVQHHPCNEAHDAEVFMVVTDPAPGGATYPIESHFEDIAIAQCLPAASTYLGADFQTRLDVDAGYFFPTRSSWNDGDRGMTCYFHGLPEGRKLTASVKNSGPTGASPSP